MKRTPPPTPKKATDCHKDQQSYVTNRPNKRQAMSTSPNSQSGSMPVTQQDVREIVMPGTQQDVREIVTPVTQQDVRDIVNEVVQTQMNLFMIQIGETISQTISNTINKELSSLKQEIESVKNSMDFINEKFENASKNHETLTKEVENVKMENSALQSSVTELTNKINFLEQNARMNNVEVQCVPENRNENLNSIIMQIARTVGCNLTEENVLHCARVAKGDKSNTRPRSIIVKLSSTRIRDDLLAANIKFNKLNKSNKLNSGHIGIAGEKHPIYIMEHLSPANKSLHAAARIKGKEIGYKHVWVRNGRIFMRKTDDSAYVLIRDKDYLNKLK
ncbi:uncharacterized protein LOC135085667 [Ostrinia nubilalis]|uniref:uncharacterized protein LOC135085667 n=1 Tax=Ostrinia nubilalis TaxID=29057 RepID=UPI00308236E6